MHTVCTKRKSRDLIKRSRNMKSNFMTKTIAAMLVLFLTLGGCVPCSSFSMLHDKEESSSMEWTIWFESLRRKPSSPPPAPMKSSSSHYAMPAFAPPPPKHHDKHPHAPPPPKHHDKHAHAPLPPKHHDKCARAPPPISKPRG